MNRRPLAIVLLILLLSACGGWGGEPEPPHPTPLPRAEVEALRKAPDTPGFLRRALVLLSAPPPLKPSSMGRVRGPLLVLRHPDGRWLDPAAPALLPEGAVPEGWILLDAAFRDAPTPELFLGLRLDGRPVPFELGGQTGSGHVLRLPGPNRETGPLPVYPFRLLTPLPPGRHELILVIHPDPRGRYARKGARLLRERRGRIGYTAEWPIGKALAYRFPLAVGRADDASWLEDLPEAHLQPSSSPFPNAALLAAPSCDETEPPLPPTILTAEGPLSLCLFVTLPENLNLPADLEAYPALLFGYVDDEPARLNGAEALRLSLARGRSGALPVTLELPPSKRDGRPHSLYLTLFFGTGAPWGDLGREAWAQVGIAVGWSEEAVPILPDRSWAPNLEGEGP